MNIFHPRTSALLIIFVCILLALPTSCGPSGDITTSLSSESETVEPSIKVSPTPLPTRPVYEPGEIVDYIAQTGDTLPALASHFNTTIEEIREANPIIPEDVTTIPPGLPLQIPIYYQPLWGSPYRIVPDWAYVYGPTESDFDVVSYVNKKDGWLKNYDYYSGNEQRVGGQLIQYVADNFSISPRLLLAIAEFQTQALSNENPPENIDEYTLGYEERNHKGFYRQLVWAANALNNGYYGWRAGLLNSFDLLDGSLIRPDPWQNAASVAIQFYFAQTIPADQYGHAIQEDGLFNTYKTLFGNPWEIENDHIQGSLQQPTLIFPFSPGTVWAYTGGPHTGWGQGEPFSAIDFAPPNVAGGCTPSTEWATAVSDGVIVRTGTGVAILDLDGDNNEQTGWNIFYLHLKSDTIPPVGTHLVAGDPIGLPSCEGGSSTGTHVHIARKYNGEWILAGGPLAFNLEGWIAHRGSTAYEGTLVRFNRTVIACDCADNYSHIMASGSGQ